MDTALPPFRSRLQILPAACLLASSLGLLPLHADVLTGTSASTIQISNSRSGVAEILSRASATAFTIGFQNVHLSALVNSSLTAETLVNGIVTAAETSERQTEVPEPSAMHLTIGALTALVVMRRRRRNV